MRLIISIILVLISTYLFADSQEILDLEHVIDVHYRSVETGEELTGERSSVLYQKGLPDDTYELDKLFDENPETAWIDGSHDNSAGEFFYTGIEKRRYVSYDKLISYSIAISVRIINGFPKSKETFLSYSRLKMAEIKIYDFPLRTGQNETKRVGTPKLDSIQTIKLEDTESPQEFTFLINPSQPVEPENNDEGLACFLKLTILDVYPGNKYHNTAISKLSAVGKLVPHVDDQQIDSSR